MGAGLPRVILTETDLSQYVDTLLKGVSCVAGITEKGVIGDPQLISSELQYERIFGGELKNSDFPLIAKRVVDIKSFTLRRYYGQINADGKKSVSGFEEQKYFADKCA